MTTSTLFAKRNPTHEKLIGIVFMLLAILLFALVDVIAKVVSIRYPPNEITFFRMLFGLAPALAMLRFGSKNPRVYRPRRFLGHLLRAVTALASMGLFFAGLPHLPLAQAVTLQYTEAMFLVLLAVVFLGERLRSGSVISLTLGFAGVCLISWDRQFGTSVVGASLILLSALFGAGSIMQIKRLSRTEDSATIVLYFTAIAMVLSGASLIFAWKTPTVPDLFRLALLGVIAGCGQLFLTTAFRVSSASLLAPFSYFGVVWAVIFGYVFFGETVSLRAAVGSVLVVASAVYLSVTDKDPVPDIPGEQSSP